MERPFGRVCPRNRTEKVTDQKSSKLRVVGTRKIADLPRDTSEAASIETCAEDVDPTASYKPSEYALHLAHPYIDDNLSPGRRQRLVVVVAPHAWESAAYKFVEDKLTHPDYVPARSKGFRLVEILRALANRDVVMSCEPSVVVDDVYRDLAVANVDVAAITRDHLTAVLRRAFPGTKSVWPKTIAAVDLDPDHLDAAIEQSSEAIAAIELMFRLADQKASEKAKEKDQSDDKSAVAALVEKAKAGKTTGGIEILRPLSPVLDELAGYGAAGTWCRDLIDDLRAYRAGEIGWDEVDRGCLLVGPPGTGKTMLASALAASAGVGLIATSYSDWQGHAGGHLGDLIRRMKAVFAAAGNAAPIIIFIDEIDAIVSRSGSGDSDYIAWWTAVVTALLELIDGTNRNEGIVVIGACNHAERLDPALVRSGRLDRRFDIQLPDEAALTTIIRYHVPEAAPVDIAPIATALAGTVSGADIARIAREAKRSARRQKRQVTAAEILAAALPPETRPRDVLWRTAVHEAGHAMGFLVAGQIPRVMSLVGSDGVAGYVQSPTATASQQRIGDLEARVLPMLMGRAAEDVLLGEASAGAVSDLEAASQILCRCRRRPWPRRLSHTWRPGSCRRRDPHPANLWRSHHARDPSSWRHRGPCTPCYRTPRPGRERTSRLRKPAGSRLMIIAFSPRVRSRLVEIELDEGIPAVEVVHQAVEMWTMLDHDDRRALGLAAMSLALQSLKGGRK